MDRGELDPRGPVSAGAPLSAAYLTYPGQGFTVTDLRGLAPHSAIYGQRYI